MATSKSGKAPILTPQADDFPQWYQDILQKAELAENGLVRGTMVIRPYGYAIWEHMQAEMDLRIKAAGAANAYFPLFIPESFLKREADHVEGFSPELAVVTHGGGKVLDEPIVVRPTSEMVINHYFAKWIQSYRDLPLLLNQWANVVRWELRPRMFLRTTEFLWQEGHTAHADKTDAMEETMRMLEVYRAFAEGPLAMPVIAGEKPENERFPGADATYSIEAMMQDGKALQAGTSHYLGTSFAEAAGIRYQDREGQQATCHTTSWGVSTRMIGGVIMVHGDDDGLRVPPQIAPHQIVILPMLRENEGDDALLAYCEEVRRALAGQSALGEPIRVHLDKRAGKATGKRWAWVKKGVPLILEIGGRDAEASQVSVLRRDRLWRDDGKPDFRGEPRETFIAGAAAELEAIQAGLFTEAKSRRDRQIVRGVDSFEALSAMFGESEKTPGWAQVAWSAPSGAALDAVVAKLKSLKLTIRNTPLGAPAPSGMCMFTGQPATQTIYVARTY